MAFLPLVAAVAGAGGSLVQGFSAASQASYQAQVARNNALIAAQNAGYSAQAGATQIEESGLKARAQQGEVRAGLAANNLDVNSGSPADVQTSQRELGGLDQANTAGRAANQVYGYEVQETNYKAQSSLYNSEIGPDIAGGILGAAGSIAQNAPDFPSTAGGPSSLPSDTAWMGGNPTLDEEWGGITSNLIPPGPYGAPVPY
jgi:hypothetical protein